MKTHHLDPVPPSLESERPVSYSPAPQNSTPFLMTSFSNVFRTTCQTDSKVVGGGALGFSGLVRLLLGAIIPGASEEQERVDAPPPSPE